MLTYVLPNDAPDLNVCDSLRRTKHLVFFGCVEEFFRDNDAVHKAFDPGNTMHRVISSLIAVFSAEHGAGREKVVPDLPISTDSAIILEGLSIATTKRTVDRRKVASSDPAISQVDDNCGKARPFS